MTDYFTKLTEEAMSVQKERLEQAAPEDKGEELRQLLNIAEVGRFFGVESCITEFDTPGRPLKFV